MTKRRTTGYNIVLARVAETSSIEHLCKIKVLSSIEVYGKNATLANTRPVVRHPMSDRTDIKQTDNTDKNH